MYCVITSIFWGKKYHTRLWENKSVPRNTVMSHLLKPTQKCDPWTNRHKKKCDRQTETTEK